MRNTKIVATLGPASRSPEMVSSLLEAGVDVFRINASHGNYNEHTATIRCVREWRRTPAALPESCSICKAPRSAWQVRNGQATLAAGARFIISVDPIMGIRNGLDTYTACPRTWRRAIGCCWGRECRTARARNQWHAGGVRGDLGGVIKDSRASICRACGSAFRP